MPHLHAEQRWTLCNNLRDISLWDQLFDVHHAVDNASCILSNNWWVSPTHNRLKYAGMLQMHANDKSSLEALQGLQAAPTQWSEEYSESCLLPKVLSLKQSC